jgi:2-polyprenyl-6-methoxyphenol hydroxylase-like FAD-dependent oxidoreductase
MADVVVMGAGVVGLATAMLLRKDGHDVLVVERDAAEPHGNHEALWSSWERRGVNQFRLVHYFLPGFRVQLERELPEVAEALDDAGAIRHNVVRLVPEQLSGGFRDGDEQFEALTARRPVMEAALAGAASTCGVKVRRGVGIDGLLVGTPTEPGTPHVIGVRSTAGEELRADLVVDALGRRSPLPMWLEAAGSQSPMEEREDSGFVYYARYFRSSDGSVPAMIAPLLQDYGSVSILTLPADNGTWGVAFITSAKDKPARPLKDPTTWQRVIAEFPLAAHWADGEPIDNGVAVMAGIEDRHRDYCPDGSPIATGVVSVGDSWACTNPSLGRGATMGLLHAVALRDEMRAGALDEPGKFAHSFAETTAERVEPWYRTTLGYDRARLAEMHADIAGHAYGADGQWDLTRALAVAAGKDGELLRARLRIVGMLERPEDVLGAPGVVERVKGLGANWRDEPHFGPSREELMRALAR